MAVAVELVFRGGTLEQYDQVVERMGFTPAVRADRVACSTG